MASAQFENFTVKENVYPTLNDDDKREHLGRLKALEDLSIYIDIIRESLSRELVVNGVKSEEDLTSSTESIDEKEKLDTVNITYGSDTEVTEEKTWGKNVGRASP